MKKYYPVFLDVEGRKCVVVGGGEIAARKAKSLSEAGGQVTVVSPEFCRSLLRQAEKGEVVLARRRFRARDLDGAFVAIGCTDDRKVNDRVSSAARRKGILVNVADAARQCDFIVPSVMSRGALTIAVSTSGVSPALARRIRKELEKRYEQGYADFLTLMEANRQRIVAEVPEPRDRKLIFEKLTSADFLAEFVSRNKNQAKALFEKKLMELLARARTHHV